MSFAEFSLCNPFSSVVDCIQTSTKTCFCFFKIQMFSYHQGNKLEAISDMPGEMIKGR